jgi:hypothetical protein
VYAHYVDTGDSKMSLSFVQLATAIENDAEVQFLECEVWCQKNSVLAMTISQVIDALDEGLIRIKPEPREYWIIPYTDCLGHKVASTHPSQWEPQMNIAGLNIDGIIHVKEVL